MTRIEPTDPTVKATKFFVSEFVSTELFETIKRESPFHRLFEPDTPEKRAARKERRRQINQASDDLKDELDAATAPLARKILDLHYRFGDYDYRTCGGCEHEGYDSEAPEWPCATVRLVADHLGISVPEHLR